MAKNKETICILKLLAGIILILAIGFLPFFIIQKSFMTGQQNLIGAIYEKDPALCEEVLRYMFSEDAFSAKTEEGEAAMVSLGYTKKGASYLFLNTGWNRVYLGAFFLQSVLALFLFFLIFRLKRYQKENEARRLLEAQNVREEEEAQKEKFLLEKNKRTQMFIENIAHQIKTPLSCVSLSMDLMLESADAVQKEQILNCFHYLNGIKTLMKKLLDIGRMEAGKILMRKEPFDMERLLLECISSLPDGTARIAFCREGKKQDAAEYYGDYEWLKEAFANILKNCLEHDKSEEKILLTFSQTAEGIKITARDHGEGIAKEDLPHIFDRFYLPEHAKKSHSGIGLNLAKLIIDQHFGSIHANSHEERGAVFTVLLPVFDLKSRKI